MAKRGKKKDKKSLWYYYYFVGLLLGLIFVILSIFIEIYINYQEAMTSFALRNEQKTKIVTPNPIINPKKIDVPILIYHYVEYVHDVRDTIRRSLDITPYIFEKQVATLQTSGYTFLTPSDINDILDNKKRLPERSVILSFDDGYGDFYTDVLPILQKYKVRAVAYIISGFIDHLNYMTSGQLRDVIKTGLVEIGCHTMHHVNLKYVASSLADKEIEGCRNDIEQNFGIKTVSFAYPDGGYNESLFPILAAAGFKNAATTKFGFEISKNNLYNIPRVRPGARMGKDLISYIEQGITKSTQKFILK